MFGRFARRLRLARTRSSVEPWVGRCREVTALYVSIGDDAVAALRARDPHRAQQTIVAAKRVLRHQFDLLGSGPYVPADPDRSIRDGYTPIDWYLDPVRRLRFPRGVPHKQWNLLEMRPGNADVKYPWELARCQHWGVLGQAYRLTRNDRFAIEIARELDDFVEANPTGVGINWTCTMDVGLRAVSWAVAFDLVRDSGALDEAFWSRANRALFDHGVFIRANLENTYEVTSNHFLSNLLGLQFAAAAFADLSQAREWNAFARASLEHELEVQVLPDGADYESSIPYHRLVTELFLGAARLADYQRAPLSARYRSRLRAMVAYLVAVTRPDGLMPQVGDADDGRLHVFEGYGATTPQDARHLFGPAAGMFDDSELLTMAGGAGAWEAAWWGLDLSRMQPADAPQRATRLFPDAGIAVVHAEGGHYLIATNGTVGTNGFGNHKHNDLLSFEFHHGGIPLVVDPGSFVYTSDADARNRFRGTAYHNTVMIDAVEQNELRPDWLFRLFETSNAESVCFDDRPDVAEYVGRHHGYERLADPVTHERTFRLFKATGKLAIVDRLIGRGRHEVRWHFHLAPGITADRLPDARVELAGAGRRWILAIPPGLDVTIQSAQYSPSYGVATACAAVDLAARVTLEGEKTWQFSIDT
jgi:hypothetical protein